MSSSGIDNLKIIIQQNEQQNNININNQTMTNSDKDNLNRPSKLKKCLSQKTVINIQDFFISYY